MDEITIHIFLDSAGEYQYGIFKGSPQDAVDADSIDGGICTSDMRNAIDMAAGHAKELYDKIL